MIQKCAKCGRVYGEKEPLENKAVTHGLCRECFETEVFTVWAEKAGEVILAEENPLLRFTDMRKFFSVCLDVWERQGIFAQIKKEVLIVDVRPVLKDAVRKVSLD